MSDKRNPYKIPAKVIKEKPSRYESIMQSIEKRGYNAANKAHRYGCTNAINLYY